MKRIICILIIFFGSLTSFSQEFRYEFKIEDVFTPGDAKTMINVIRSSIDVQVVKFLDEDDLFQIFTHLDFDIDIMLSEFVMNGIFVDGEIIKTTVE